MPIAKINKNENLVLKIRHFTHFLVAPPLDGSFYSSALPSSRPHNSQPRAKPTSPMQSTAAPQSNPRRHNPQTRAKSNPRPHKPKPRAKPNLADTNYSRAPSPTLAPQSTPRPNPTLATTIHSLAPSQTSPKQSTAAPQFSFQHKKTDPPHPHNRGSPIKSSRAAICKSTPNPIRLNYLRFHTGGTAETPITPIR